MWRPRQWAAGLAAWGLVLAHGALADAQAQAPRPPAPVTITGEILDTWCYLSGVMGPPDATVGSAHHTCAVWCAAGGIPVGLLADDGKLYMVLKLEDRSSVDGNPRILSIQASRVTARGTVFQRDGLNYIVVDRVLEDQGVVRRNHADFGVVPPFVIPDDVIARVKQ